MARKLTPGEAVLFRRCAKNAYLSLMKKISDADDHQMLKSMAGNQARKDYEFLLDEIRAAAD